MNSFRARVLHVGGGILMFFKMSMFVPELLDQAVILSSFM